MHEIRRLWTKEDHDKIRRLAGKNSLREIARQLDRTEDATRLQAWKLGVKIGVVGATVRRTYKRPAQPQANGVEQVIAPVAIERALSIYKMLQERDQSVMLQARKILTQHIYGMVDRGETDEQRLTVGGLTHLKAIERDHATKPVHVGPSKDQRGRPERNRA